MKKLTGWWFTFAKESDQILAEINQRLSHRFGNVPTFIPHLSFYDYTSSTTEEIQEVATELSNLISPFTVKTTGISYDTPIHKTLFIEVEVNNSLLQTVKYMEDRFQMSYVFKPHISLLYDDTLPESTKKELCAEIVIPQELTIDTISFYNPPLNKESARYYPEWPEPDNVSLKKST